MPDSAPLAGLPGSVRSARLRRRGSGPRGNGLGRGGAGTGAPRRSADRSLSNWSGTGVGPPLRSANRGPASWSRSDAGPPLRGDDRSRAEPHRCGRCGSGRNRCTGRFSRPGTSSSRRLVALVLPAAVLPAAVLPAAVLPAAVLPAAVLPAAEAACALRRGDAGIRIRRRGTAARPGAGVGCRRQRGCLGTPGGAAGGAASRAWRIEFHVRRRLGGCAARSRERREACLVRLMPAPAVALSVTRLRRAADPRVLLPAVTASAVAAGAAALVGRGRPEISGLGRGRPGLRPVLGGPRVACRCRPLSAGGGFGCGAWAAGAWPARLRLPAPGLPALGLRGPGLRAGRARQRAASLGGRLRHDGRAVCGGLVRARAARCAAGLGAVCAPPVGPPAGHRVVTSGPFVRLAGRSLAFSLACGRERGRRRLSRWLVRGT